MNITTVYYKLFQLNLTSNTTDLHAFGVDDIESCSHFCGKLDDFVKALISDTPGAVNQIDQVCFGTFAHCDPNDIVLIKSNHQQNVKY